MLPPALHLHTTNPVTSRTCCCRLGPHAPLPYMRNITPAAIRTGRASARHNPCEQPLLLSRTLGLSEVPCCVRTGPPPLLLSLGVRLRSRDGLSRGASAPRPGNGNGLRVVGAAGRVLPRELLRVAGMSSFAGARFSRRSASNNRTGSNGLSPLRLVLRHLNQQAPVWVSADMHASALAQPLTLEPGPKAPELVAPRLGRSRCRIGCAARYAAQCGAGRMGPPTNSKGTLPLDSVCVPYANANPVR